MKEAEINLAVAEYLREYLVEYGFRADMTRSGMNGISSEDGTWEKNADMQARKNMVRSGKYDLFISIHQNSYPDTSCRGGQVFYSDCKDENRILADILQKKLAECAPFENKRTALINNDYMLLQENAVPSVIVECGFMTNPAELEYLLDDEYRKKIAENLASGVSEYITNHKK